MTVSKRYETRPDGKTLFSSSGESKSIGVRR